MAVIGKVSVKVWPDTRGFRKALRKQLHEEAKGLEQDAKRNPIKIPAEIDQKGLRESARNAVDDVQDDAKSKPAELPAEVKIRNPKKNRRDLWDQASEMTRARGDSRALDLLVGVNIDERAMKDGLNDALKGAEKLEQQARKAREAADRERESAISSRDAAMRARRDFMLADGWRELDELEAATSRLEKREEIVRKARERAARAHAEAMSSIRPREDILLRWSIREQDRLDPAPDLEPTRWARMREQYSIHHARMRSIHAGSMRLLRRIDATGFRDMLSDARVFAKKRADILGKSMARMSGRALGGGFDAIRRLSGMRLAGNLARDTWEPLSNFDLKLPRMLATVGIITQLSATITSLSGHILTLGRDIGRILPGALALPGAFVSAGIGLATMIIGLRDINKYAPEIGRAFDDIPERVSRAFWKSRPAISKGLVGLAKPINDGMVRVGESTGKFVGQLATSLNKIMGPKLGEMFKGAADGFQKLGEHAPGIATAMTELGLVGAKYFPQMTEAIGDSITSFGDFMKKAREDGSLDRWVERSKDGLRDLGGVLSGTYGLFDRLSSAAENAGGFGLGEFADGLEKVNKALDNPKTRRTVEQLFGAGYKTAGTFLDGILGPLGGLLTAFAPIAESFGTNISKALGGSIGALLEGFTSPAMMRSVENFGKAFGELGDIIAPVLKQSGEVAGILDTINAAIVPFGKLGATAVGGVLQLIDDLGPSLADAVTNLGNGAVDLAKAIFGPLVEAAKGLGPLLEGAGEVLGSFASRISKPVETALGGLKPMFEDAVAGIMAILTPLADGIATAFEFLGEPLARLLETAGQGFRTLGEGIGEWLASLNWEQLGRNLGTIIDLVTKAIEGVGEVAGFLQTKQNEEVLKLLEAKELGAPTLANPLTWATGADAYSRGFTDTWGNITDEGRAFMEEQRALAQGVGEAAQEASASAQGSWENLFESTALETESERAKVSFEDLAAAAEESSRRTSDAIRTLNDSASFSGLKSQIDDFSRGLINAAPALSEHWKKIGGAEGAELAQKNSGIISEALRVAEVAAEKAGIKASDFGNKYSEAWQKALESNHGPELEAALEGIRTAMEKTGISTETLKQALSDPNLSASAKAQLGSLLEVLQDSEAGQDRVAEAQRNLVELMKQPVPAPKIEAPADGFDPARIYGEQWRKTFSDQVSATVIPAPNTTAFDTSMDSLKTKAADTYAALSATGGVVASIPAPDATAFTVTHDQVRAVHETTQATLGVPFVVPPLDTSAFSTSVSVITTSMQQLPGIVGTNMQAVGGAFTVGASTVSVQVQRIVTEVAKIGPATALLPGAVQPGLDGVNAAFGRTAEQIRGQMGRFEATVRSGGDRTLGALRTLAGLIPGTVSRVSLYGAGTAIMGSLIRGINARRGELVGTLQSITRQIEANKGPKHVDAKLLTPAGELIMQSLLDGFRNGFEQVVKPGLQTFTREIGTFIGPEDFSATVNRSVSYEQAPTEAASGERVQVNYTINNPLQEQPSATVRRTLPTALAVL